ncbi:MAG: hypothetical protein IPN34_11470 [Planctomycetes bacterium]|nr:hypothetical protein [Planctomycetota bacterium]
MHQRALVGCGLLAVLLAAIGFFVTQDDEVAAPAAVLESAEKERQAPSLTLESGSSERSSAQLEPERSAGAATLAPSVAVASPKLRLEVFDRASGEPVAGASVAVFETEQLSAVLRQVARKELGALEESVMRVREDRVLRTDALGVVELPIASSARWLSARHGALRGALLVPPERSQPLRLELVAMGELRVFVRDPRHDAPSGTEVSLLSAPTPDSRTAPKVLSRGRYSHSSYAMPVRLPYLRETGVEAGSLALHLRVELPIPGTKPFERAVTQIELEKGEAVVRLPSDIREAASLLEEQLRKEGGFEGRGAPEPPRRYRLEGLLQLADGALVAHGVLGARLRAVSGAGFSVPWQGIIDTDASGSFAETLELALSRDLTYFLDLVLLEELAGDSRWMASIPWWLAEGSERQSLGLHALHRRRLDVIATGVVLDDAGNAVVGARIAIGSGELEELCGSEGPLREALYPDASFVSGEEGRFELRGLPLAQEFALIATKELHFPRDPIWTTTGQSGLRLELVRAATLEGRLLCDADVDPRTVQIEVRSALFGQSGAQIEEDGSFRAEGLPPGEVSIRFASPERRALVVSPILTIPGAPHTDARLQPVDLRTEERILDVLLLEEDGAPLGSAAFYVASVAQANGAITAERTDAAGRAKVLFSGRGKRWLLGSARHVPVVFEERGDVIEIRLRRTRAFELRFEPALELPPASRGRLFLRARPPGTIAGSFHGVWQRLAEACGLHIAEISDPQRATIELVEDGVHATQWVLRVAHGSAAVEIGPALRAEAKASAGEVTVSVRLETLRALHSK